MLESCFVPIALLTQDPGPRLKVKSVRMVVCRKLLGPVSVNIIATPETKLTSSLVFPAKYRYRQRCL